MRNAWVGELVAWRVGTLGKGVGIAVDLVPWAWLVWLGREESLVGLLAPDGVQSICGAMVVSLRNCLLECWCAVARGSYSWHQRHKLARMLMGRLII